MATLTTYRSSVDPVDVAVIGAGINGLAIAREAASRGLSVALFDRDDVGARTSSISTRLIHGGLKYLERFELNLVYESIRERNILLKRAPHLVHPYPMIIPFSAGQSRPGWLLACGLMLHDVLSVGKPLPMNRVVFRKQIEKRWPGLAAGGLKWGGLFQDANVPLTERLCVELAVAAAADGAAILTHTEVVGLLRDGSRVTGLEYRDRVDGSIKQVQAGLVVNAAGPWVDGILDLAGRHERMIGPTKGSHLVVDPFPGAPETCIFFESPVDTRPMFVLPFNGRYMIGTTDIPFDGDLENIAIDDDEIAYLLDGTNTLLPEAKLTVDDVLWSYAGVRPLPYVEGMDDPSTVTRDHQIITHTGDKTGLITIIGGKLTTHRALGELVAKVLVKGLRRGVKSSPTRTSRFPGTPAENWDDYRAEYVRRSRLSAASATRLVEVYGVRAEEIEKLALAKPALTAVVDVATGAIAAEAVHAVLNEGAFTLEDVVLRRTVIGINGDVGLSAAPVVADVLVEHAGWSREYADEQVHAYAQSMRRFRPRGLRSLPDAVK